MGPIGAMAQFVLLGTEQMATGFIPMITGL